MDFGRVTKVIIPTVSFSTIGIYFLSGGSSDTQTTIVQNQLTENLDLQGDSPVDKDLPFPTVIQEEEQIITLANGKSEEQKKIDKAIADKAFEKINDYSFRLFSSCGVGTAWILDYELTENNKYPTTWYIATAAHAVNKFRFSNNRYEQPLPYSSLTETRKLQNNFKNDYRGYSLYGDNHKTCGWVDKYGYFDINIAKSSNGKELGAEYGAVHNKKMEEPSLFFAAIDLFDADEELGIAASNYKDFAVLEIKFNDEKYAKEVTKGFADKYTVDSKDAINMFAKPLDSIYSKEQLSNLEENFYDFAYPVKGHDAYGHTVSWDPEKAEGFKLSRDPWNEFHFSGQEKVRGFGDSKRIYKIKWGGKEKENYGHYYTVDINKNYALGGGASGSLVTDRNGNVLGLYGGAQTGEKNVAIIPLRGNEKRGAKDIKSPQWDLILGAEKQKNSYKQQVITHNKNTWLRARKWEHKN